MVITFTQNAPAGTAFHKNAFDENIGKKIAVNLRGEHKQGVLVRAKVASDGASVTLSVEIEIEGI